MARTPQAPAAYNRAPSADPWHGQRVLVRGEARRGGSVVLRCVRDELKGFPTLKIPEWMFDSNLCARMKPAEMPQLDCAALLPLKHLLATAKECSQQGTVQAQHDPRSSGDADAQAMYLSAHSSDKLARMTLAYSRERGTDAHHDERLAGHRCDSGHG